MTKKRQPFGTWESPITAATVSEAIQLPEAAWSPDGRHLVWLEEHSGQGILFLSDLDGNDPRRLTGDCSVRASIGYGGGHFTVGRERVYYVERDGRLYSQPLEHGGPRPLTVPGMLCSSPALSPDGRWLVFVYELAGEAGLALVEAEGRQWPVKIAEGLDFYMQPVWHPRGSALAWIGWNHPRMPWDGTGLFVQPLREGAEGPRPEGAPQMVAGGVGESVLQPEYAPDGSRLAYLSDRDGWYRLYVQEVAPRAVPLCLTTEMAEFAGAAWQMGMRWYGWRPGGQTLLASRNREGTVEMVEVDAQGRGVHPLRLSGTPYTSLTRPVINPEDGRVAVLAAAEAVPTRLIVCDPGGPAGGAGPEAPGIVRRTASERYAPEEMARSEPITWRSAEGESVHGLFAAPSSSRFASDGLPPLVVQIHGGPTSQAYRTWRPDVQFFTSRGYAVLDVNHRGSTGYGRAYRERLREGWGVVDVEDALSGLRHVAERGWADTRRCAIKGGSAGGYTVLRALVLYPEAFRAAVCLYGISDLFALARETHKFEAHYLDALVGPLPEAAERYRERSPLSGAERIRTPLLLFQGEEDRVVPASQSERIVASLRARGVPHEYHLFPGEGHGFRRRETVRAVYEVMERFLRTHLVYA